MQTILFLYNFQKQSKYIPTLKRINNAQKDAKKAGTGVNRDERKYQILNKYIIHEHCKLNEERKKNMPQNPLLQLQQMNNQNQQQMPQMPQIQAKDLFIRFLPRIISKIVFSGKSPYLFYFPWLEKMMKKETSDPTIKLIIFILTIGGNQQDTDHQGYITRFSINFIFNRLFKKLLEIIFFRGINTKIGLFKQLNLQHQCSIYSQKQHGQKVNLKQYQDLIDKYPDIIEISEVEAQNEDTSTTENQESSNSNSKI